MTRKKGALTIEQCVEKAQKCIEENEKGVCLLLYDVVGAKTLPMTTEERLARLDEMDEDLNKRFSDYFPENNLSLVSRRDKGFKIPIWLGDGNWAGINSAEIIPEMIGYQKEHYPDIPLEWGIAKDGWDEEGLSLIR